MVCINVAKRENGVNAALTKAAGLEDKVIIPGEKSFFETGMPDESCDVVCSQDALLHAGSERHKALAEVARVLKPGGRMVFTDIMQSEEAEAKDLQEVREGAKDGVQGFSRGIRCVVLSFVSFSRGTAPLQRDRGLSCGHGLEIF